jgi:tRNA(adenine34) deaminase
MKLALELAMLSASEGEIPIGCVIVNALGEVIGRGRNRREHSRNALAHAEIEAIDGACKAIGAWRLEGCTAYVTLEPCPMCRGAFRAARLERVYYGASNINPNALGAEPTLNGGLLAAECKEILTQFFKELR